MRVLYVSKAMTVATYRDKLRELARLAELHAVIPSRWGSRPADAAGDGEAWLEEVAARLHGHNHFHVYARPLEWVRDDYDIVHIDEEPYSAATAQIARVCERRRLPFVFFAWQNVEKRIPPPFSRMRGYVFERARGGIAGTAEAAAVLRGWGFERPIAIIPQMGIDPGRFCPDPAARCRIRDRMGASEADFVIGFGGRLVPEKGVQSLVRAASRMPATRLVILGDGPARESIEAEALRCGLAGRMVLRTDVRYDEMPGWLNALDALVLPSVRTRTWKEQFGRVLVEAMACGTAVVGSSSGEIPNVIGDAGLVFPEGDESGLVAALERLSASPALRSGLGEAGRRRATGMFSNRRIVSDTMAFYESLLEGVAA